jgi:hypothetical protein
LEPTLPTKSTRTRNRKKRSTRRRSSRSARQDAIAMLRDDHTRVSKIFDRFEHSRGESKQKLAEQACSELEVHAKIEEEIFYPAVRESIHDADLMDEAKVEHQSLKDLISQIRKMEPDEDLFDAKVKVLGEYVKHHVKEEQGEMFPKARQSGVDLEELAQQMRERRAELTNGGPLESVRRLVS